MLTGRASPELRKNRNTTHRYSNANSPWLRGSDIVAKWTKSKGRLREVTLEYQLLLLLPNETAPINGGREGSVQGLLWHRSTFQPPLMMCWSPLGPRHSWTKFRAKQKSPIENKCRSWVYKVQWCKKCTLNPESRNRPGETPMDGLSFPVLFRIESHYFCFDGDTTNKEI